VEKGAGGVEPTLVVAGLGIDRKMGGFSYLPLLRLCDLKKMSAKIENDKRYYKKLSN
jgi:hypothetical protein